MNMYTYYFLYINIYAYVIGEGLITSASLRNLAFTFLCRATDGRTSAHCSANALPRWNPQEPRTSEQCLCSHWNPNMWMEEDLCGDTRCQNMWVIKATVNPAYQQMMISPCLMVQSPFLQIYPYHLLVQSPSLLVDILLIYSWVVHLRVISYPEIKHCWIYH